VAVFTERVETALAEAAALAADPLDDEARGRVLTLMAQGLAPFDAERAERLVEGLDADSVASVAAFAAVAEAAHDPVRALGRALRIDVPEWREQAVQRIVELSARRYPERAYRIAAELEDVYYRSRALAACGAVTPLKELAAATDGVEQLWAVEALATVDVEAALDLAATQPADERLRMLARIASAVATVDAEHGLALALAIKDDFWLDVALREVAPAIAATDVERALALAEDIEDLDYQSEALSDIAPHLARTDPARARALAEGLPQQTETHHALVAIAETLAPAQPDEASRLAAAIEDPEWRARALIAIAVAWLKTNGR
jgi:hypothetical protein